MNQKSIYTILANKHNLPVPVIEVICNSAFKFASERMRCGDEKPIMFTYLGKLKIKKKYKTQEDDSTHI